MMERFFNNAGPSVPDDHYMVDPLQRIDVVHIERLVRQKRYFVLLAFPEIRIANRIYQESIPRELVWTRQIGITHQQHWYLTPERRLDMPRLLQAFLQRIVNGGGRIYREYGLGRRRTDLFIEWPTDKQTGFQGEVQRIVLELKIRHGALDTTLQRGLAQTVDYADKCAADELHLLIFDRRSEVTWEEKIWHRTERVAGRTVSVWGL